MLTRREFTGLLGVVVLGMPFPRPRIAIQPLAPYEPWAVDVMSDALADVFGYAVDVRDPVPVPEQARDPRRGRYHAPSIVTTLGSSLALGITHVDICQPNTERGVPDWGVFGVARIGGPGGLVSTYRVRDPAWFPKIVVHEAGHLAGHDHCDVRACQMRDVRGAGSAYADIRYGWFCDEHQGITRATTR